MASVAPPCGEELTSRLIEFSWARWKAAQSAPELFCAIRDTKTAFCVRIYLFVKKSVAFFTDYRVILFKVFGIGYNGIRPHNPICNIFVYMISLGILVYLYQRSLFPVFIQVATEIKLIT